MKKWTFYLWYTAAIKKYAANTQTLVLSIFSAEYCNYKWKEQGVVCAAQIYYAREIPLVNPQNQK